MHRLQATSSLSVDNGEESLLPRHEFDKEWEN